MNIAAGKKNANFQKAMNPGRAEERGDHIVFKRKNSQFFTGNESALQQECI